jgi:hypothetical protein
MIREHLVPYVFNFVFFHMSKYAVVSIVEGSLLYSNAGFSSLHTNS